MTKSVIKKSGQRAGSESAETVVWFVRKAIPELTRQIVAGELDKDQFQALIAHQNPFEFPGWIRKRTKELDNYLLAFFGKIYDLTLFEETLKKYGKEQVEKWEGMGLKVGFFPKERMSQRVEFPGWKIKLNGSFYDRLEAGSIFRYEQKGKLVRDKKADELEGIVVLFDTRCKPFYSGGAQMWSDDKDFLGDVIDELRRSKKIQKWDGSQSSRFYVSSDEWQKHLRSATAVLLGLEVKRVRLERAIEFNVLPQIYLDIPRCKDRDTNTFLWLEEFLASDDSIRLDGGHGGLADVTWSYPQINWGYRSFRPLAVLAS